MESHSFSLNVAKLIGLKDAIILQHFVYWWKINLFNGQNLKDGNYWTYQKRTAIAETFPYLTPREVQLCCDRLEKEKYIETGNFNKNGYDRTIWYSITCKTYNLFEMQIDSTNLQNVKWNKQIVKSIKQNVQSNEQNANSNTQNENTIPYVTEDVTEDVTNIKEGEETPTPQIENDFVVFEVVEEKAEIENKANNLPLEEKKEKEKKVAPKKEKETKPDNKKDLLDVYADEESFSIAWGLRFGAKYPNIDASKAYTKLLQYSLNKGVKYADWVLTAKVWYEKEETAAKRSTWEVTEKSQTTASKMQSALDRLTKTYEGPF